MYNKISHVYFIQDKEIFILKYSDVRVKKSAFKDNNISASNGIWKNAKSVWSNITRVYTYTFAECILITSWVHTFTSLLYPPFEWWWTATLDTVVKRQECWVSANNVELQKASYTSFPKTSQKNKFHHPWLIKLLKKN